MSDEAKDVPPHADLLAEFVEWATGTLILAACTGLLGFAVGQIF